MICCTNNSGKTQEGELGLRAGKEGSIGFPEQYEHQQ